MTHEDRDKPPDSLTFGPSRKHQAFIAVLAAVAIIVMTGYFVTDPSATLLTYLGAIAIVLAIAAWVLLPVSLARARVDPDYLLVKALFIRAAIPINSIETIEFPGNWLQMIVYLKDGTHTNVWARFDREDELIEAVHRFAHEDNRR